MPCPTCDSPLQPGTKPAADRDPAAAWYCPTCSTYFAECFFCRGVWSRCGEPARRCRTPDCPAHDRPAECCPRCGAYTMFAPSENATVVCHNPRCTALIDTTWPPAPTPLPTMTGAGPAGVEPLLRRIAAQSHFEERYELHQELFRGGMGQVWRATDRILGREVAVKMMHAPDRLGGPAWGQFLKEARVGGRLLHPNILPVFDLGINRQGHVYFTMRLVRGASLWQSLDALATGCATHLVEFPLRRVIRTFRDACQGVDFAHQHGVLHLDLKPNNLLVSGFKEVFVIDWGLARVDNEDDTGKLIGLYEGRQAGPDTTYAGGGFVGTPAFMAPEQAFGRLPEFGPPTDVYGLGGVLFFILYGDPPNRPAAGGDWKAGFPDILTMPLQPGRLRAGILPRAQRVPAAQREAVAELERICRKCLERNPADRYATVEELLTEVNEWLAESGGVPE